MNLIDKFKRNYQKKFFETYLNDKNFHDLFQEIEKYINSKDISLLDLINNDIDNILNDIDSRPFVPNNIIWINSFENAEATLVHNFLDFYLSQQKKSYIIDDYQSVLAEKFSNFKKEFHISFDDLIFNSYLYQLVISLTEKNRILFLKNQMAFFEHSSKKNFTHPALSKCYIYIVRNPLDIYQLYKNQNPNAHFAQNKLLNLDQSPSIFNKNSDSQIIEITKKSWSTNIDSWDSENIKNSLNGIVLKYESLINDPEDQYSSLITHLIQSGLDLELDYKLIEEFSLTQKSIKLDEITEISNKEKKIIFRDIKDKSEQYFYN